MQYRLTKQKSSKREKILRKHQFKLEKLSKNKSKETKDRCTDFVKQSIHNFSNHQLSPEEKHALSFRLDQYIPTSINKRDVKAEFEVFYQNLLRNVTPTPDAKK